MTLPLPAIIDRYIGAANAGDIAAFLHCFSSDAVVHDEGMDYRGSGAIKEWKERTDRRYGATVKPVSVARTPDETIVTADVAGDFPGSPVALRFCFTLTDNLITALEIKV
jgi:hypothetical protein